MVIRQITAVYHRKRAPRIFSVLQTCQAASSRNYGHLHLRHQFLFRKGLAPQVNRIRSGPSQTVKKMLPVALIREDVRLIPNTVRLPRHRACLSIIYACGIRLQEGPHLTSRLHRQRARLHSCPRWQGSLCATPEIHPQYAAQFLEIPS